MLNIDIGQGFLQLITINHLMQQYFHYTEETTPEHFPQTQNLTLSSCLQRKLAQNSKRISKIKLQQAIWFCLINM